MVREMKRVRERESLEWGVDGFGGGSGEGLTEREE
jgi:hypothetical protein